MGKKWAGFDPTGLERAAKAARELDQSGQLKRSIYIHGYTRTPLICTPIGQNKVSTIVKCPYFSMGKHSKCLI